jgi:hypothetical protein
MRPVAERNVAAEVRAVEEGHRALLNEDGSIRVVSDTRPGKAYRVEFTGIGGAARFTCRPEGDHAYHDDHRQITAECGALPCKHAAVAARRLERQGLLRVAGMSDNPYAAGSWILTDEAQAELSSPLDDGDSYDPFDGLPC